MARQKNPRVQLIRDLTILFSYIKNRRDDWRYHSRTEIFDATGDGSDGKQRGGWRPRRPEEYIETKPEKWRKLAKEMMECAEACDRLARFAREQAERLEKEEKCDE